MVPSAALQRNSALEAVESLLPAEEVRLLRLNEEGKRMSNELMELRFQHCVLEDKALLYDREIVHLQCLLDKSTADRAFLDAQGVLPPPSMMPSEAAAATRR